MGVTLSFGGTIAGLAMTQFGQAASSASVAASVQQQSLGPELSLVLASVSNQGACSTYLGAPDGSLLSVVVFNYGTLAFAPSLVAVNGTVYASASYPSIPPGGLTTISLSLSAPNSCAHPSGLTLLIANLNGDESQFAT